MKRPTQKVFIIYGGKHYAFDAVVKSDHQHQLEIAEDHKDMEEKQHVRYAIIKPSMLTMEVSVSDTVTAAGEPLSSGAKTRSEAAYKNLYQIQRARSPFSIVTRMFTFTDMMIETLAVTEDAEIQDEMRATITFKQMIVVPPPPPPAAPPAPTKSRSKPPPKNTVDTPQGGGLSSVLSNILGVVLPGKRK